MNYETVIASAVHNCPLARDFQRLFPNADHAIVQGKRQSDLAGWKSVTEWISRAHLHDRYVAWLVVAIEISPDQIVSQLEEPELYVIEVKKVTRSRDDASGAEWEVACVQFEEGDWAKLVESGGDFASLEFEMTVDAPVARFATFWHDTRPIRRDAPPDSVALRAPLRFMT